MKKKLDTRFPAARIKKIMQADEDVGKIAMATPVLISKALELFLQNLCNKTYEITLRRGAKTMSSLHLKQCVQQNSVFDFLKDIVSKVPDIGTDPQEERNGGGRRRKVSDGDNDDSEEEDVKRPKAEILPPTSGRGRGRGRGKGRGRGRNGVRVQVEGDDSDPDTSPPSPIDRPAERAMADSATPSLKVEDAGSSEPADSTAAGRQVKFEFDLNMDLDENGDVAAAEHGNEVKEEEEEQEQEQEAAQAPSSWPPSLTVDIPELGIGQLQDRHTHPDEDDYDCDDDEDG